MTLLLICLRSTENEPLNESLGQEETDERAGILEKRTPGGIRERSRSIQQGQREEVLVKSSLQP